jgi:hypothetical protein
MWIALADLARCLEAMADGVCPPKFYLSSLDPGVGKTQTVVHFLRSLLFSPRHEHVGVVIFISVLTDLQRVIEDAGLAPGDFAVLTSNEDMNGLSPTEPPGARVLFTTQQRLLRVCSSRQLGSVDAYKYRGSVRQVRVWDEELLPAAPVLLDHDDIASLYSPLRAYFGPLVHDLEHLFEAVKSTLDDGVLFDVPHLAERHQVSVAAALQRVSGNEENERRVSALWWLFGKKAVVRRNGPKGNALVSFWEHLPGDLPPLVILDASGRVRHAYVLWEQRRGTLERLAAARKRYDRLDIHLWDAGGGKSGFATAKGWTERRDAIVAAVNATPDEDVLVICHKGNLEQLQAEVPGLVEGDPSRVRFLHWGRHRATNEYASIRNVVLAGTLFPPAPVYEGIARAAADLAPEEGHVTDADLGEVALGEHKHAIIQALCRAAVRRCEHGSCPPCHAYIIGSARSGITKELLEDVFPGSRIVPWTPHGRPRTGKVAKAFDFIEASLQGGQRFVPFQAVKEAIGVQDASNFRKDVRLHPDFVAAIDEARIAVTASRPGGRLDGFCRIDAAYFGFKVEDGYEADVAAAPSSLGTVDISDEVAE